MSLTKVEIDHLASLVRLELSDSERQSFEEQLPQIIEFVDTLRKAKHETVEDSSERIIELKDLRADEPNNRSLSIEQIGKLAPTFEQNQVVVPHIFGDD